MTFAIFLAMSTSGGVEKDVVGDERLAGSDDRATCGGMNTRVADVGTARGVGGNFCADAFELTAAYVFKILTLRRRGGGFVEIDRNLVALPDFFSRRALRSRRNLRW